ncbi:hypothetical protein DFH09DRAFT_1094228 [Mycena vulgaris]|nr:hypothetical protein DFH09DRAFT_1094228 [Mycena vulgaris]
MSSAVNFAEKNDGITERTYGEAFQSKQNCNAGPVDAKRTLESAKFHPIELREAECGLRTHEKTLRKARDSDRRSFQTRKTVDSQFGQVMETLDAQSFKDQPTKSQENATEWYSAQIQPCQCVAGAIQLSRLEKIQRSTYSISIIVLNLMTIMIVNNYLDGLDAYFDGVMRPPPSGVAASPRIISAIRIPLEAAMEQNLQSAACPPPTRSTKEVNEATNLVSCASDFDSDLESAYPDFQNEYGDFPGDGAAGDAPVDDADETSHAGHYLLGVPGFDLSEFLADCRRATTD